MGYIAIAFVDSPSKVFEQGYGKDAATIAMHAISAARDQKYDVVLIDTAGIFSFKMTVQISLAQNWMKLKVGQFLFNRHVKMSILE